MFGHSLQLLLFPNIDRPSDDVNGGNDKFNGHTRPTAENVRRKYKISFILELWEPQLEIVFVFIILKQKIE